MSVAWLAMAVASCGGETVEGGAAESAAGESSAGESSAGESAAGESVAGESAAGESVAFEVRVDPRVELLGEYEADRGRYPTMTTFMPRVAEYFRKVAGSG